jgi:hypothetical protein
LDDMGSGSPGFHGAKGANKRDQEILNRDTDWRSSSAMRESSRT